MWDILWYSLHSRGKWPLAVLHRLGGGSLSVLLLPISKLWLESSFVCWKPCYLRENWKFARLCHVTCLWIVSVESPGIGFLPIRFGAKPCSVFRFSIVFIFLEFSSTNMTSISFLHPIECLLMWWYVPRWVSSKWDLSIWWNKRNLHNGAEFHPG